MDLVSYILPDTRKYDDSSIRSYLTSQKIAVSNLNDTNIYSVLRYSHEKYPDKSILLFKDTTLVTKNILLKVLKAGKEFDLIYLSHYQSKCQLYSTNVKVDEIHKIYNVSKPGKFFSLYISPKARNKLLENLSETSNLDIELYKLITSGKIRAGLVSPQFIIFDATRADNIRQYLRLSECEIIVKDDIDKDITSDNIVIKSNFTILMCIILIILLYAYYPFDKNSK